MEISERDEGPTEEALQVAEKLKPLLNRWSHLEESLYDKQTSNMSYFFNGDVIVISIGVSQQVVQLQCLYKDTPGNEQGTSHEVWTDTEKLQELYDEQGIPIFEFNAEHDLEDGEFTTVTRYSLLD